MKLSDSYAKLFQDYRKVESAMAEGSPDLQRDLQSAARAIVRFECENQLPRLRELVTAHRNSVSEIEVAKQKLNRLESSIRNQEFFILKRFSETDTTVDALDLLGWRESARIGAQAIEALNEQAADLEAELKTFVKDHRGVSECIEIESSSIAWNKSERENFSWMARDFQSSHATLEAVAQAA